MSKKLIIALAVLSGASTANAFWGSAPGASATVSDSVLANANSWTYSYALSNTDSCVGDCGNTMQGKSITGYWLSDREFALPYFADSGIDLASVTTPLGWSFAISDANPFGLLNASSLVWRANGDLDGVALGATLAGFGYTAAFGAGKGPFSVTNGMLETFVGDPAIPLSPMAVAAGISAVPEPSTWILLMAGLTAVGILSRRPRAEKTRRLSADHEHS